MKENKNTNELIPELIVKINKYSSKLKDRVKIDSIFREFDSYAHSNFQNFIKMSEQRYKSVKSGNNLKNVLLKQQQESKDLSNKILTNNLYLDNDIEKESKKLFKKINKKENKELYQIRHNIIDKTKSITRQEVKKRQKYIKDYYKREGKNKKFNHTNYKDIENYELDRTYKPRFKNISKNVLAANKIFKRNESTEGKEKEDFITKKAFFDNLVNKDHQNINNNISDYKEYLKDIEKTKDNSINRIINSGNNFGHNYSFKFNDIKLLTYKEEKKEDTKINKKENPEIDIVKLMRYTKRGNKKWFQNNLKQRSINRLNSFKNKFKKKRTIFKSSSAINIRGKKNLLNKNKNEEEYNKQNDNSNNDVNMMGATTSTAFSNFRNTIKTVKNEAEMIKYINENFDKKRNTMEGFFKRNALPKIEEYDIMFVTRNNFRKVKNNKNNELKDENVTNNKNNLNGNNKHNIQDKLVNMEIFEDFQKTYNEKKIKWKEEDIEKERIKQKEKELIEETKKYLKEIKQVKRKPHLYVDPYSKRDELINNRIKLFTRSLSGPFYSQKKMQNKLNDFNNYIELKEIEKKKNDEIFSKTLKEEEKKRREEGEEYKLMAKIRRNLAKDNSDRSDIGDIRLNYKFISTLKMCKNEDKDQPYKDYKEIIEIIKDKKKDGEYDLCNIKEVKN